VTLSSSALDILVFVALGIAVLAFVVSLVLAFRLRKLRRSYAVLQGDGDHGSFVDAVQRHIVRVDSLNDQVAALEKNLIGFKQDTATKFTEVDADIAQSVSRVAVVRFDAFEQLGGRLSFAAALLDDHGDGIVLSSIHGRSETRVYAKGVRSGQSDHPLTPEERQAIGRALGTITS
jgi:hypothetical protein